MKKFFTICILLGAMAVVSAQEKKPVFEKQGELIKGTMFHDNGEISQTGLYNKDGKLHGTWTSYDANGNKTAVATYENGEKVGKWFFWSDGLLKEVDYKNAKIVNVSTYKMTSERVVSNE